MRREFFERPPTEVARGLLGKVLVRNVGGERMSGIVVETEAYGGSRDPASHAYRGMTPRNSVMFGEKGHAYVYFSMGLHFCVNVTAGPSGIPGAVLLRALEPLEGVARMMKNRGTEDRYRLTRGPGNLTKALGIDRPLNGKDMVTSSTLFFIEGGAPRRVGVSARIGVTGARTRPWRYFALGNPNVSGSRTFGQNPRTHN